MFGEMEVEKPAVEFSKEELRRQLYSSLRSTGVLDSMKGQLRARLLEHLRHHNGESMEMVKRKQGKPSLTARLLSSLFLDYLECNGFTFTISVFMPESQMASWRPFAYEEMLELLQLDPSSNMHVRLKLGGEGRECLAHQLVTVLQQMAQRNCITEVSTQTSPAAEPCQHATQTSCTSPKDLERSMKEVEDAYVRKREAHEAQRALPYSSLEDKITILHQEFDARVNAEVALQFSDDHQVSRLRDYEINAARMDEAARYRRQLARDREELEDIHKSRMDRIKAREESLLERMLSKEKAIETSAYEQRQKILTEIINLRERENKIRQLKDSQELREEKLDEKELLLRAKEEEVVQLRNTLYVQADEITALRRKELEEQYKELCDRLQHDRTLLEAEREQMKEEKVAMAIELAASRSDKELIQALHHRLRVEEDQRLNLVKTTRELEARFEEKLKQQRSSTPVPVNISDQRVVERLRELQFELEQERLQRQASEKESKTLERKLQQKKVELAAARAPQGEWITEHKNLMATIHQQDVELQKKETKLQLMEIEKEKLTTRHKKLLLKIDHLDTLVKEAQEEKDRAAHDLGILQDQHKTTQRELLETVTLLRKAKQALETERLDHCALQSHKKTFVPSISVAPQRVSVSQDKHEQNNSLFEPRPSADEIIRKKWETFRKKPRRESHDLWTHVLSDNAAKKLSHDQDLARVPINHFPASTISKPFSSGLGYQLLEVHNDGSFIELDGMKTNGEAKSFSLTSINGLKDNTVEEFSSVKGGFTKTEALIGTVVTGSINEELYASSCEEAIPSWRKTPLSEVAKPFRWNNNGQELNCKTPLLEVAKPFSWNNNGHKELDYKTPLPEMARPFSRNNNGQEDLECKTPLPEVARPFSWNNNDHEELDHKIPLPDMAKPFSSNNNDHEDLDRKTPLPEVARLFNWNNNDHEELDHKSIVTSRVCDPSEFDIGVRSITKDSGNAWNLRHCGDPSHTDGMHSQWKEKMAENYDYQEPLSNLQDLEMTTEIGSGSMPEIHTPTATSIQSLKNSQEEMKAHHMGVATTVIAQRDTAMGTCEIECKGGLSNLCTQDVLVPDNQSRAGEPKMVVEHDPLLQTAMHHEEMKATVEGYDNPGYKGSKEKVYVTSNDGKEKPQTSVQDLRAPWDPEEHQIDSRPNEMLRSSVEPTEHVANRTESLTVQENLVVSDTKEDDEHVQEGAENSWTLYLGEEEVNTREESEAEDCSSQDSTPSCKCLASLKRDLESVGESTQSGDELLMSGSCGPRMDSQSESEQHDSATEATQNLAMKPETQNIRLSAQSVDDRYSKHLKCEDDKHDSRSEIAVDDEADKSREMAAVDEGLLLPSDPMPCDPSEVNEPVKLTNDVDQVAIDLTSLVPIPTESEETGATLSISDGDSAEDSYKDLNKLMRCLGLTKDEQQEDEEPLSQRALSLNSQNEDSYVKENAAPASGKMSGLPEMGEMLYKQELQQAREKAQKNLPDHLLQESTQDLPERVEVKGNKNVNLDSPRDSKHDRHALETLRTSIIMGKQELSETPKESPRLMDWMGGQKIHPTLALAIRNNRLVKLEMQDEFEKTPRSSFLNLRDLEATTNPKSTQDEKQLGKETPRKSPDIQNLSETTHPPAPCGETHSSSEESIYQGDSFEEEDDEGDQEPAYSQESCTNAAMRQFHEQAPGFLGLETNERSSPRSKLKAEDNDSRSSANWEGESEQGSYCPDGDESIADLPL